MLILRQLTGSQKLPQRRVVVVGFYTYTVSPSDREHDFSPPLFFAPVSCLPYFTSVCDTMTNVLIM